MHAARPIVPIARAISLFISGLALAACATTGTPPHEPPPTAASPPAMTVAAAGTEAPALADPVTEPAPAELPASLSAPVASVQPEQASETGPRHPFDPWEPWNRRVHAVNNALDRGVVRPVALGYVKAVPMPVRDSLANFFRNLGGPVNIVNALLQGKPSQAGDSLFRFLVNSTFGIGGLLDVATRWHIPDRNEDFGQTFAKWGWRKSRYVELPLFGPRTVRDVLGLASDAQLNPLPGARSAGGQAALQAAQAVNVRAQLLSTDAMREGAHDDYILFRDAWWQRRNYQIWGEDTEATEAQLPDYLLAEPVDDEPTVPESEPKPKPH